LGSAIELGLGPRAAARPCAGRLAAARRALRRVAATHGAAALAFAARADVGLALALLLACLAFRFLALRSGKVAPVLGLAVVFRGAGFAEGDGNCLPAAFHLAASAAATALQLPVLELVHDAASGLALARG